MQDPSARHSPQWPKPAAEQVAASPRRRQLLRAATSAVPLIATLPSGAALAQGSAVNCAQNEKDADTQPTGIVPPDSDRYLKVPGFIKTFIVGAEAVEVYHIPKDTGGLTYDVYVYGPNPPSGKNVGDWFDVSTGVEKNPPGTPVFFLYQYDAPATIASPSSVQIDPVTGLPSQCNIVSGLDWTDSPYPNSLPESPEHCFFPLAEQAPPGSGGNMPLTESCMCSLVGCQV